MLTTGTPQFQVEYNLDYRRIIRSELFLERVGLRFLDFIPVLFPQGLEGILNIIRNFESG
jgi:hypothetical protein